HVVVGNMDNTKLYFGIQRPMTDGLGTLIVEVNLKRNDATGFKAISSSDPGNYFELKTSLRQPDGTGMLVTPPAWLTNTLRVWGNWTSRNELDTWGVEVVIPRANLLITGTNFKLWFEAISATLGMPVVGNLSWPRGSNGLITQDAMFNNVYPDPNAADPSGV